jgi:hypothetical protein
MQQRNFSSPAWLTQETASTSGLELLDAPREILDGVALGELRAHPGGLSPAVRRRTPT